jgi:hypothetical protein
MPIFVGTGGQRPGCGRIPPQFEKDSAYGSRDPAPQVFEKRFIKTGFRMELKFSMKVFQKKIK